MNWTPLRVVFGRDSLRAGQVASWLQIGPSLDGPGYRRLRLQGATHVVDLRDECCDDPDEMDALGIRWRRLPIVEYEAPTMRQLNHLMRWLEAESDEAPHASLYLHGAAGHGRTTTVAIALLMHQEMTLEEAQRQVFRACPVTAPSAAQRAFLLEVALRLGRAPVVADLRAAGDG